MLHEKYNLKVDEIFPGEIMTLLTLQKAIEKLKVINISIDDLITGDKYDLIFWSCVLTDKKIGFLGNGKEILFPLIKQIEPHIKRLSN